MTVACDVPWTFVELHLFMLCTLAYCLMCDTLQRHHMLPSAGVLWCLRPLGHRPHDKCQSTALWCLLLLLCMFPGSPAYCHGHWDPIGFTHTSYLKGSGPGCLLLQRCLCIYCLHASGVWCLELNLKSAVWNCQGLPATKAPVLVGCGGVGCATDALSLCHKMSHYVTVGPARAVT
jgi:hypothetical protein